MSLYYAFARTHTASLDGSSIEFKSKAKPNTRVGVSFLFNDAFRALSRADMLRGHDITNIKCDGMTEDGFIKRTIL